MPKILLGFMGSGKTTIARLLDENFIDMDFVIEERIGMTIVDYFNTFGESAFRKIESQVLEELLALPNDKVIASGGGVILSEANQLLLKKNKKNNIFLDASFEVIYERIALDTKMERPLFLSNSKEEFKAIYQSRYDLYRSLSGQCIQVDSLLPEEIVRKIK